MQSKEANGSHLQCFPLCPYHHGYSRTTRFICSCLLFIKIKNPIWGLVSFEMSSESWERNPGATESQSHGLCTSKSLCLCLRKSGSSPRVQKSLRAFLSYLSTFLALLVSLWSGLLSFPSPHIYTYLLVTSLLNSQYSLDKDRKILFNPEALRCREVKGSEILWEVHNRTWLWAHISLC